MWLLPRGALRHDGYQGISGRPAAAVRGRACAVRGRYAGSPKGCAQTRSGAAVARNVAPAPADPAEPFLLRIEAVAKRYGLPVSRIRKAVKAGSFPAPLEFGPRSHYWDRRTLDTWDRTPEAAAFARATASGKRPRASLFGANDDATVANAARFFLRPFLPASDKAKRRRK
jgi:predicted DNA-binding transcriptional regulator AlpA